MTHGKVAPWWEHPKSAPLGHILTNYDGSKPQYTHLMASMLTYAHINFLSVLSRFTRDEAVREATDSIYVRKSALNRLEGVKAFIPMKKCYYRCSGGTMGVPCLLGEENLPAVAPVQWRDKDEELYMPVEHAAYLAKPDCNAANKGPLSQHRAAPRGPAVEAPLELPKQRRQQRQNHASDQALPPERSPRLHPDPLPGQRDAGQGRPGPDRPQLLPMEWPDGVDA